MKKRLHAIWYGMFHCTLWLLMFPLYRMKVFGRENVPNKGPVLIAANHQSFLDPIFCQIPVWRPFHFIARDTLYDHWFFGPLIRTLNTIPIRRGQSDVAAMRAVIQKLQEGHAVCIYPESTRTQDGRIADVKAGFALLARRSQATIVPTIVDGAYEAWPRNQKHPRLGRVGVLYGTPITADEVERLGDREFARQLTTELRRLQSRCRILLGKRPYDYSMPVPEGEPEKTTMRTPAE